MSLVLLCLINFFLLSEVMLKLKAHHYIFNQSFLFVCYYYNIFYCNRCVAEFLFDKNKENKQTTKGDEGNKPNVCFVTNNTVAST